MKFSDKFLLAAAVVSLAVLATVPAVISGIYYGRFTRLDAIVGGMGFIMAIGLFAFALAAVDKLKDLLLKLFLSAFFFSHIFLMVRGPEAAAMPMWAKLTAGFAFLALFVYSYLRFRSEGWRNFSKFIIVAAWTFTLSPVVFLLASSLRPTQELGFGGPQEFNNQIVIVLDETSPEYASGIIQNLKRAHLYVKATELVAAGRSTTNAIPSMLSQTRHDDVSPCNWSALCGRQNFDFSSLSAIGSKTDIVGFWHPYCAIRGLRSCTRVEGVFGASSSLKFGLYELWCTQFNRGGIFSFCKNGVAHVAEVVRAKKIMISQVNQAPFWRDGGLLIVHFPLPHPSMTRDFPSLKAEYESNVAEAERFVAGLTAKMISRFGADFSLVITSDHALRTAMWCASPIYARAGCATGLPANRDRVPYIVASPQPITRALPSSTVGLLVSRSHAAAP